MKKTFLITIIMLMLSVSLVSAYEHDFIEIKQLIDSEVSCEELSNEGMTCQFCVLGVEYELKQVDGVFDAKVNYQDGTGTVTFDPARVDIETIVQASTVYVVNVVDEGFIR